MNVEDIKTLNIDGEAHDVADLSDTVQQMVEIFNSWNNKEVDARNDLMMLQAAKADLSRQIITQVRADNAPAEETETEEVDAPTETDSSDAE